MPQQANVLLPVTYTAASAFSCSDLQCYPHYHRSTIWLFSLILILARGLLEKVIIVRKGTAHIIRDFQSSMDNLSNHRRLEGSFCKCFPILGKYSTSGEQLVFCIKPRMSCTYCVNNLRYYNLRPPPGAQR